MLADTDPDRAIDNDHLADAISNQAKIADSVPTVQKKSDRLRLSSINGPRGISRIPMNYKHLHKPTITISNYSML